jgi:hypothetical protein
MGESGPKISSRGGIFSRGTDGLRGEEDDTLSDVVILENLSLVPHTPFSLALVFRILLPCRAFASRVSFQTELSNSSVELLVQFPGLSILARDGLCWCCLHREGLIGEVGLSIRALAGVLLCCASVLADKCFANGFGFGISQDSARGCRAFVTELLLSANFGGL